MKYLAILAVLPAVAFGADGVDLSFFDKIIAFLASIQTGTIIVVLTAALEFVFRLFKTTKPLSIAWVIVDVLKKLVNIFTLLAALLDKILPQVVVKPVDEEKK